MSPILVQIWINNNNFSICHYLVVPHFVLHLVLHLVPQMVPHLVPHLVPHFVPHLVSHLVPDLVYHLVPHLVSHLVPQLIHHLVHHLVHHSTLESSKTTFDNHENPSSRLFDNNDTHLLLQLHFSFALCLKDNNR